MLNGITSSQVSSAYSAYATTAKTTKTGSAVQTSDSTSAASTSTTSSATADSDVAAVYEPSSEGVAASKTYTQNTDLVNQLKADAEARTSNLQSLVQKLMTQQATTYGNATDIWSFLREGNFTVDEETKKQAQEDISEDGYWGVEQTSDRIVSFATALTGGDPDKIDSMIEAFEKGYKMAEETWGGELPEISQKTYGAVLEKFQALKDANELATEE